MRNRIRAWACAGIALAIVAGAGCGNGDNGGSTASTGTSTTGTTGGTANNDASKPFKITMIAKSQDNPVFISARVGAEAAAEELSGKMNRKIEIDWQTPPTEDGQEQANRVRQAVSGGTDAILISCSDASKVKGAIDDAVAQGIPVMTFDSDAPDSKRFAFYGVDDVESGQMVMQELATLKGGKGNIAILAGNQNAPNLQKRVQGVKDVAAKYPGIKIVGVFNHVESPQAAAAEVMKDMNAYPEIDGWAMVGGWALFTPALLKDLDASKVKIVSIDALPDELGYVDKGLAPVLLAQPTYEWGNQSVRILVDHVLNKKEVPAINKMSLVRVTKENLNQWAKQLRDWKFEKIDPKYLE